jgi:hypothetical protein
MTSLIGYLLYSRAMSIVKKKVALRENLFGSFRSKTQVRDPRERTQALRYTFSAVPILAGMIQLTHSYNTCYKRFTRCSPGRPTSREMTCFTFAQQISKGLRDLRPPIFPLNKLIGELTASRSILTSAR